MKGHVDLMRIAALAVLCAIGALLPLPDPLRLLFAAPLTLFLPGYAVLAAARLDARMGRAQAGFLGVGLSLAVLAVGSLPLNYLGGLHAGTWAALLTAVTIVAALVAARRRPAPRHRRRRRAVGRPAALALAATVAGAIAFTGAVALAFVPVAADDVVGYSELWMRPLADGTVRVGVGNQEHEASAYGLIARFGGGADDLDVRRFRLDPGEQITFRMAPARSPARPKRVVVTLYRAEEPNVPYRRVFGWVMPPALGQ